MEKLNKIKEENEKYRPKKMNRYSLLSSTINKDKNTNDETVVLIPGKLKKCIKLNLSIFLSNFNFI